MCVCDPLRSLQMSIGGLGRAGQTSPFDVRRVRESRKPEPPGSTLGVPPFAPLIPLYPGEAGCQVWGGEGGAGGDKSSTNT